MIFCFNLPTWSVNLRVGSDNSEIHWKTLATLRLSACLSDHFKVTNITDNITLSINYSVSISLCSSRLMWEQAVVQTIATTPRFHTNTNRSEEVLRSAINCNTSLKSLMWRYYPTVASNFLLSCSQVKADVGIPGERMRVYCALSFSRLFQCISQLTGSLEVWRYSPPHSTETSLCEFVDRRLLAPLLWP